jgi:hypothetical protein
MRDLLVMWVPVARGFSETSHRPVRLRSSRESCARDLTE